MINHGPHTHTHTRRRRTPLLHGGELGSSYKARLTTLRRTTRRHMAAGGGDWNWNRELHTHEAQEYGNAFKRAAVAQRARHEAMARAEGNKDTFTKETEQTRDDGGYGIRDMHAPAAISACRRLVYEGNQLWPRRGPHRVAATGVRLRGPCRSRLPAPPGVARHRLHFLPGTFGQTGWGASRQPIARARRADSPPIASTRVHRQAAPGAVGLKRRVRWPAAAGAADSGRRMHRQAALGTVVFDECHSAAARPRPGSQWSVPTAAEGTERARCRSCRRERGSRPYLPEASLGRPGSQTR
eukprot:scaffold13704_cov102-Isochrysis_galbana.AAC.2